MIAGTDINAHRKCQQAVWNVIHNFAKELRVGDQEVDAYQKLEAKLKETKFDKIWHPTVLKFDESTLNTSVKHRPVPERALSDIAIIDLGVVVDNLEIDCGTSVGFTSESQKLVQAMHEVYNETKTKLESTWQHLRPSDLFNFVCEQAKLRGYEQIAASAGHLVGPYPTPKREVKITADCLAESFPAGWWMIEIYLGDGKRAAFFEDCVYLQ